MSELFNLPETLSPRLQWMQDHKVRTHHQPLMDEEGTGWTAWLPEHDWDATHPDCYNPEFEDSVGMAANKEDAIMDMAIKNNIKLWNQ